MVEPDLSFLDGAVEFHIALGLLRHFTARCQRQLHHGEIGAMRHIGRNLFPPQIDALPAIYIYVDLIGAAAGTTHAFFIGLADIDLEFD